MKNKTVLRESLDENSDTSSYILTAANLRITTKMKLLLNNHQLRYQNKYTWKTKTCHFLQRNSSKFNEINVEFTSSDNDKEWIPESPMLLLTKRWMKQATFYKLDKITLKSTVVRDEFTFNASDNDDAPESSMVFLTNIEWRERSF